MSTLNKILTVLFISLFIYGCGGQGSSTNIQPWQLPGGPLQYSYIESLFESTPQATQSNLKTNALPPLGVFTFFVSWLPVSSLVSEYGVDIVGGALGLNHANEINSQFNELTTEVTQLNNQMVTLESQLVADQNIFYNYMIQQSAIQTSVAYYNYYSSNTNGLNSMSGDDGYYQSYLQLINESSALQIVVESNRINGLNNFITQNGGLGWLTTLQNLSNANVPVASPESSAQTTASTSILYGALYAYLQGQLATIGSSGNNIVPFFESYNDNIFAVYSQNVQALYQGYLIEANNNYLNFMAVANAFNQGTESGQVLQLNNISGINSTFYQYQNQSYAAESASYQLAQENLALLYAARVNILYNSTMQRIVSDKPAPQFVWPLPPTVSNSQVQAELNSHPYQNYVVQNVPAYNFAGSGVIPNQNIPSVNGSTIFYQYDNLPQIYQCASAWRLNESLNTSNCPPLYPNPVNQNVYNGTNFNTVVNYATGQSAQTPTINLNMCANPLATLNVGATYGVVTGLWCVPNNSNSPYGLGNTNTVYTWFDSGDPHATFYFNFNNITNPQLINFVAENGTNPPHSFNGSQFQVDTAKSCMPDPQTGVNCYFAATFTYGINGYSGLLTLQGVGSGDFHYGWNMNAECSVGEALCTQYNGGLCINGNYLEINMNSTNGNTATVQFNGGC